MALHTQYSFFQQFPNPRRQWQNSQQKTNTKTFPLLTNINSELWVRENLKSNKSYLCSQQTVLVWYFGTELHASSHKPHPETTTTTTTTTTKYWYYIITTQCGNEANMFNKIQNIQSGLPHTSWTFYVRFPAFNRIIYVYVLWLCVAWWCSG